MLEAEEDDLEVILLRAYLSHWQFAIHFFKGCNNTRTSVQARSSACLRGRMEIQCPPFARFRVRCRCLEGDTCGVLLVLLINNYSGRETKVFKTSITPPSLVATSICMKLHLDESLQERSSSFRLVHRKTEIDVSCGISLDAKGAWVDICAERDKATLQYHHYLTEYST